MIRSFLERLFPTMNYKHWAEQLRERIDQLEMEGWEKDAELVDAANELAEMTVERNEEVQQLMTKVFDLERENERLQVESQSLYDENVVLKTLVREDLG